MKRNIKKTLLYAFSIFLFLVIILGVHIYLVYRPAPSAYTRVMARIDIKQKITRSDADKITAWMVHQKGVDHVLVNPETSIVVFTFFPLKTTGNEIVSDFKTNFHLKAERFIPSAEKLKSSCPVAKSSYTYRVYKFITQII
ncbi:MAG: hypothetical protein JWP37_3447 [Mucilaginibacter sp.]|nr:hypothetical protein [Mucilaginibacter sp.]